MARKRTVKKRKRKLSPWIKHVMAYHKSHGGSYSSSLKAAAKTWKSKKASAGSDEKKKPKL